MKRGEAGRREGGNAGTKERGKVGTREGGNAGTKERGKAGRREGGKATPPDWGSGEEYFGPRHAYRLHLILKLRPKAPGLCLDAACGLGTLSARLKAEGFRPIGMDLDFGAARVTGGKGFPVVIGRMETLPFKSGSLPAIFSSETLEHVPDLGAAAAELARVLAAGGSLVLSVPANERFRSAWDEWAGHLRRFSPGDLDAAFAPLKPAGAVWFGFPLLLLYETLFLRRFVRRRAAGEVRADRGRWRILKGLLSAPLECLFRLRLPPRTMAVGVAARFVKEVRSSE
jgi:SAM-dependent methyltransferase